jgi:hypothetical protein
MNAPDNDDGLRRNVADYLIQQFVPADECLDEADHILALVAAQPPPSTGNDGGADYRKRAREVADGLIGLHYAASLPVLAAALAGSAAAMRERCEAILRKELAIPRSIPAGATCPAGRALRQIAALAQKEEPK